MAAPQIISSVLVKLDVIDFNTGQIPGVPSNPRDPEVEYFKLKDSLTKDAAFTTINELVLYPFNGRYVAISGNMRVRAAKELGWKEISAKILPADTKPEALTRYILLGNAEFGKWDTAQLAEKWAAVDLEALNVECNDSVESLNPDDLGEEFELPDGEQNKERTISFTLTASQADYLNHVIGVAKQCGLKPPTRYNNADEDANFIHLIALQWEEQKKS